MENNQICKNFVKKMKKNEKKCVGGGLFSIYIYLKMFKL